MLKNKLLTALTLPFRPAEATSEHERILVVSTTGLGDTLWSTPAIRALKTQKPNSCLAVLTSPIGSQVLKHNPHIDHTFIARDPLLPRLPTLVSKLKKHNFDTVLVFHTSQRLALPICAWTKAPVIAGTRGINKGLDHLLTHPVEQKNEHEITRRLRICKRIGINMPKDQTLEWHISDRERLKALQILSEFDNPIVALHPGAKDQFKQWPAEHFVKLGNMLVEAGLDVAITGNFGEAHLAEPIAKQIPLAKSIAGKHSLRVFSAFLKYVDLVITNDTGPMHIAFAHRTPTIALFGPTDPNKCGPHHAKQCKNYRKIPHLQPMFAKVMFGCFLHATNWP